MVTTKKTATKSLTRRSGYRVIEKFDRHTVKDLKRVNTYYRDLPRHKRLMMMVMDKLGSKKEIGSALLPQYTNPITGKPIQKGEVALDNTIRRLNQNGYKEKYPLAKIYSIPYTSDDDVTESGIVLVQYVLVMVYGKTIDEVIARSRRVIGGIERSIGILSDVKAMGSRKILKQLNKYKQQIQFDVQIVRKGVGK